MATIGHHYSVYVCPDCHEQVYPTSTSMASWCDSCDRPMRRAECIDVFLTEAHVRLKTRQQADRR